jgi:HEAT repeat protein
LPLDPPVQRVRAAQAKALLADCLTVAWAADPRKEDFPDAPQQPWADALRKRFQAAAGVERIKLACLLTDEKAVAIMRAALKHPDAALRHRAALALLYQVGFKDGEAQIDPREGRTVLVPIFLESLKHAQPWWRVEAAQGLSYLLGCSPEALPALLEALKDGDPRVRRAAVQGLENIRQKDAKIVVAALAPLVSDAHVEVRLALAVPLGSAAEGFPLLARLLGDEHAHVRGAAWGVLNTRDEKSLVATPALVKPFLKHPKAAVYLWNLRDEGDFPLLLGLLSDHDAEVRQALKHAGVAGADAAKVVSGLLRDLGDADPQVVRHAAHTLWRMHTTILPSQHRGKILVDQGAKQALAAAVARQAQLLKTGKPAQRPQAAAVVVQLQGLLWSQYHTEWREPLGAHQLLVTLGTVIEAASVDDDFRVRREVRHALWGVTLNGGF